MFQFILNYIKILVCEILFIYMEETMGKIFCLIGKSSSGKDTIFRYIKDNKELNLKSIIL